MSRTKPLVIQLTTSLASNYLSSGVYVFTFTLRLPPNWPTAVAKTRTQLNRRLPSDQKLRYPPFGRAWYAGCTTLIIGNSLKAGIRFVAFDAYKSMLQDEAGKISGPRTVIAGFGAGITESLLAVTPFESIKTSL